MSLTSLRILHAHSFDFASKNFIEELDLSYSHLWDATFLLLATGLKSNTSLKSLNLDSNSFGDEGIQYLSEILKVNASLTKLSLKGNHFGEEGAQCLADALKFNYTLRQLDLDADFVTKYEENNNKFWIVRSLELSLAINRHPKIFATVLEMKKQRRMSLLNIDWTPERHIQFPKQFRDQVKELMMCVHRQMTGPPSVSFFWLFVFSLWTKSDEQDHAMKIPQDLWIHMIIPFMARWEFQTIKTAVQKQKAYSWNCSIL